MHSAAGRLIMRLQSVTSVYPTPVVRIVYLVEDEVVLLAEVVVLRPTLRRWSALQVGLQACFGKANCGGCACTPRAQMHRQEAAVSSEQDRGHCAHRTLGWAGLCRLRRHSSSARGCPCRRRARLGSLGQRHAVMQLPQNDLRTAPVSGNPADVSCAVSRCDTAGASARLGIDVEDANELPHCLVILLHCCQAPLHGPPADLSPERTHASCFYFLDMALAAHC